MSIAIRAEGLTKSYNVYPRPIDRLLETLTGRSRHTVFPALQDVTFEVERGETVGIVGQNGAGKSTLLKLLCGVTRQTSGSLHTDGTIASILELGTGFHPEFSGRENASLNAAILGLSSAELRERLPAILEFSELGSFLDRPVKTYSSGMYMRLAFSVAVNANPAILIIDEALAVGDGHFQKKCVDKIREFQEAGKTILFCSHALYHVSSICRRALWLDQGQVIRYGPVLDVVHDYETFLLKRDRERPSSENETETHKSPTPARFRDITVCDANGEPRQVFERGEDIHVRLRIEADRATQPIHALVGVHRSADDLQCFAVGTHSDRLAPLQGQNRYELVVQLSKIPLNRGDYSIIAFIGDENAVSVFDRKDIRPAFSIQAAQYEVGLVSIDHRWVEAPMVAASS